MKLSFFDLTRLFLACCLLNVILTSSAKADAIFTFTLDNDGIFAVDKDYTNGINLSYTSNILDDTQKLSWFSVNNPDLSTLSSVDKFEFSIGHKMWTPADIANDKPIINDRPYAGFLYTQASYLTLTHDAAMRYNLTLGTTGDSSLSEQTQRFVHSITGSPRPNGWDYQIDDRFIVNLGLKFYKNIWHEPSINNHQWDINSITDINAGNFRTDIAQGLMLRFGSNLAGSIGAANIDYEAPFTPGMIINNSINSWFIFSGINARYRFTDLTLEGSRSNLPAPTNIYDIKLKATQFNAVVGFAWYSQNFGLSVTTAAKTAEYENSPANFYGIASLSAFIFW